MVKGTVKFFNHTKGFGFITEEESGKDYFVHSTGILSRIQDGDAVEFELADGALEGSIFRMLRQGQRVVFELDDNNNAVNLKLGSEIDMGTPDLD